jgi:deoxyribodipyrimidine photolyase-related protein
MRDANLFRHKRKLTSAWYEGTTGIPPFDDMVKRLDQRAYAHQAERLLVAGNLMLLCEIDPNEVYNWFNQLFIDAYDWSLVPNVYSLSQFADGGTMGSAPAIIPSEKLFQISDYQRDDWADIWDGLFWRFVEKHKEMLGKNPAMRPTVQRLSRLDHDRKRIIHYRAEDFLTKFTR